MSRLIGFLLGLSAALVLAVVAVRYPLGELFSLTDDVHPLPAESPTAASDPAAATVSREPLMSLPRVSDDEPAGLTLDPDGGVSTETAAASETEPESDPAPAPLPAPEIAEPPVAESPPPDPSAETMPAATATAPPAAERRWFAFWLPFHSELSAEGFRTRLERVTGLDYRIESPTPGEYQVAFAYRNEAERQQALAAIEAATGLALRNDVL